MDDHIEQATIMLRWRTQRPEQSTSTWAGIESYLTSLCSSKGVDGLRWLRWADRSIRTMARPTYVYVVCSSIHDLADALIARPGVRAVAAEAADKS